MNDDDDLTYADGMIAGPSLQEMFAKPAAPSVAEAARGVLRARNLEQAAERALAEAKKATADAETAFIQLADQEGVLSVKVECMGGKDMLVTAAESNHYRLQSEALSDASVMTWIFRSGGESLVRRTVHHMAFSGFCRELVEQGRPLHNLIKVVRQRVVRVKAS